MKIPPQHSLTSGQNLKSPAFNTYLFNIDFLRLQATLGSPSEKGTGDFQS